MEKRRETRHRVRQLVNVSDKVGVLNDISRKGVNISLTSLPKERKIDLKLKLDGKDIKVSAIVMWAKRKLNYKEHNTMGMILVDPPQELIEYCISLDNKVITGADS
ncbi:MAG: PilZ domain-containing protein [Acidobacteriota bacterium]